MANGGRDDDQGGSQIEYSAGRRRAANLHALEAVLEGLGQNLITASRGEQALKCVLEHDFAVILLDVQMPGMSGIETAALIRARERSRATPIIFLTGMMRTAEMVFSGYSAGAVDYLMKPLEPEVLRAKVAVFVELRQGAATSWSRKSPSACASPSR